MTRGSVTIEAVLFLAFVSGCSQVSVAHTPTDDPLILSDAGDVASVKVEAHQGEEAHRAAPGFVKWCASGGAPIVGLPVVDDQERTYVATSDGYLHAFERDGRFRWSYTVKGTPLGSVSLRPSDGAILMGTTGRYIYAINQDGGRRFRYPTLTPVWSGLFALNASTVVFLGHDRRVYALSNSGYRRYRVRAPSTPMGGPVIADNDVVWLPLEDGVARFEAAFKLERFPHSAPVEQVVVLGDDALVRAGGQAYRLSPQGAWTELGAARLLASDGERGLLITDERIRLVEGSSAPEDVELVDAPAPAEMSAPPTLVGGAIWIPYEDGTLRVFDLKSGVGIAVEVGKGALSQPVVGRSGNYGLIPEPGGRFCAVQISRHPSDD